MPFVNIDQSGSTLTHSERSEEAIRILRRIADSSLDALTPAARQFVEQQQDQLHMFGTVSITVPQLFWLREINSWVD